MDLIKLKNINVEYFKRNGNGMTTCLMCRKYTWDSFCYNVRLYIEQKMFMKTILCGDCLYDYIKKNEKV